MPNLRERVEESLKERRPLSKLLYRQLLEFDAVETTATELGYMFRFEPRVPIIKVYREMPHPIFPWYVSDNFGIIPKPPEWLEKDGWVQRRGGILLDRPTLADEEAIDIISEGNNEINLYVHYFRAEDGQAVGSWDGTVHSVQAVNDLLRSPPKV